MNRLQRIGGMVLLAGSLALVPLVSASFWSQIFQHRVDVLTVTDVTDAGKAYAPATPAHPVYYKIIDLGLQNFGRTWAGENIPPRKSVLVWMVKAMAAQGYRLADAQHAPTQLFVFGWGMLQGGPDRPALQFLGGDKVDLMWEQDFHQTHSFLDPKVLLRGSKRNGVAGIVWDTAESDLFLGLVRSFTMDSETAPKVTLLWETRFACPATGLGMNEAMPLLVKAAAINLGRETKLPVNLDASEAFGGHVDLGPTEYLGTYPSDSVVEPAKPGPRP